VLGPDLSRVDALVMAAAVADYRPAAPSATKVKKGGDHATIELVKNPDLLAEVGAKRVGRRPVLVGFAVETEGGEALVAYARRKLVEKRVDLVVANEAIESFGRDDDRATLVTSERAEPLARMKKLALADVILDRVRSSMSGE
jgi:phosphopantothenoylcysteine decarboxylase/phosphopantothenate--cysteine ligase